MLLNVMALTFSLWKRVFRFYVPVTALHYRILLPQFLGGSVEIFERIWVQFRMVWHSSWSILMAKNKCFIASSGWKFQRFVAPLAPHHSSEVINHWKSAKNKSSSDVKLLFGGGSFNNFHLLLLLLLKHHHHHDFNPICVTVSIT